MSKRRSHRKAALATSLAVGVGCGSPTPSDVTTRNLVEPARLDPSHEVEHLLAKDAVSLRRFARATLYTWTSLDQVDELRTTRKLLSRDESPVSGASFVDQVLFALAGRGDPLAKLLYTTAFSASRFAWPSMWPTRAGWPTEQYGDQLVRIQLKPDAWIVALSTDAGIVEVHDLRDEVVPIASVLANPKRIAAIYFVSDAGAPAAPGVPRPLFSFREYVVCNESMIESWEVGTTRIAHEVAQAAATIDSVVVDVRSSAPRPAVPAAQIWRTASTGTGSSRAYYAALALDNANYALDVDRLEELARLLRATPKPPPIEGVPTATFAPGVVRKPPRIVDRSIDVSFARPSPTAAHP